MNESSGAGAGNTKALKWLLLALVLIAGGLLRVHLFYRGNFSFDSDQAVAGIGALRVLQGGPHYVLAPGQSHSGEFFTYYFLPFHWLAPPSVALLRLGMIPLALLLAVTTYFAARAMFGCEIRAVTAFLLVVFPASVAMDWYTRPHSLYVMVQIGLNLSVVCLFRLLAAFETKGWSTQNILLGFAVGFLVGFCFWCHFSMMIPAAALAMLLLTMPRMFLKLAGLIPAPRTRRWRRLCSVLSAFLQVALLVNLAVLSGLLVLGGGDFKVAGMRIGLNHIRNPLAIVVTLLVLRVVFDWFLPERPIRRHLGMVGAFAGLWLGAAPLIIYIWVQGNSILDFGTAVKDLSTFRTQTLAAIQVGLPMLVGQTHMWNAAVVGIPAWVKGAALAIHCAALFCLSGYAVVGRLRRWPAANGCLLVVFLFVLQVLLFGRSTFGEFIGDARYVLLLHWALVMSVGCLAYLISRLPRRLGWCAIPLVGFLCLFNVWNNLVAPTHEPVKPTGEDVEDRKLLDFLEAENLNRVSCRFSLLDYWIAYKLTYISGEKIILAPAPHPLGTYIRSRKYQRLVDEAATRSYLVTLRRSDMLCSYVEAAGGEFKMKTLPPYAVFYDLAPDVLDGLNFPAIEAGVNARRNAPADP